MNFFFCRDPNVLILSGDQLKLPKDKSVIKTKLTPISLNSPVHSVDKGKGNRIKNTTTLDDIFDNDDDDEIQGDASGITIPISKSLGNNIIKIWKYLEIFFS